jgi:PAS domain S-box-containing protein
MRNVRKNFINRALLLAVVFVAVFGTETAYMLVAAAVDVSAVHPVIMAVTDAMFVALISSAIIWHFTIQPLWRAQRTIEKLAIVASNCQHGVVIADAEGRIEWVNESFMRLTGFTSQEVIGAKAGVFLHGPRTDPETCRVIREGLKAREIVCVEIINYTKRGREFWNSLRITPVFNEAGELIQFVGTQTDISERKRAEEQLVQAHREAEHASRAKSDFLATMSHELRTPLNGILGMQELLLMTQLSDRQRQYVEACNSSGKMLVQLINDILDLSKIEAGKLELDLRESDVAAIIYDVVEFLSNAAREKGLALSCQIAPEACVVGLCDDNRLRQTLVNLIGNAIKFTSFGNITVTVDRIAQRDHIARLRFNVSDTGVGIPTDRLDRLFKPFSQVDSSTTRQFGGTGLGLSICKHLVELMGGEIGVHSQVGIGTSFWFEIPIELSETEVKWTRQGQLLGQETADRARVRLFEGHILVAEDNHINQLYIIELLKHFGCTTALVTNGYQALAAVQQQCFDMVLMDCQMPEMDGFTAAREIRRREIAGELSGRMPIIALTANVLKGDRERCLEAGMDEFLAKPLQAAQLKEMLVKFLRPSLELTAAYADRI